jgi:hypothetical protein
MRIENDAGEKQGNGADSYKPAGNEPELLHWNVFLNG